MSAGIKFRDFYDFSDGLNTTSSAITLKPTELRDVQNMNYFPLRGFSKRNGYTLLNSAPVSSAACTGLYMARYSTAGGTNFAFLINGTSLYSMTASLGGTWSDITGGLTITTGANNIWCFDILNNICVLGNGTDTPIQISSTPTASALTGGSIPFTKFLFPIQSRGYMWYFVPTVGGNVLYDRGYFSDINAPSTFTSSSQFVDIFKGQGGDVRGAVDYKGFLFVFKRHGIYALSFQPTQVDSTGTIFPWIQNANPIVTGVGTQSHRSIVKFTTPATHQAPGQELVFFVDQFGVPRIFDGSTTLSFSSKIGSSRDSSILSLTNMDQSRNPYIHAVNYPNKNRILCFMSRTSSQQDTCWVMDYNFGFSMGRYKYASAFNVSALMEKSNGSFKPYLGDYAGSVVEDDLGSTDNGSPISDYAVTGDIFLATPAIQNKWLSTDIRGINGGTSQATKVSYYVDGQDTPNVSELVTLANPGTLWGAGPPAMIWGQSSWATMGVITRTSEPRTTSKTIRVKIESNDKTADSLILEGFTISGIPLSTVQS